MDKHSQSNKILSNPLYKIFGKIVTGRSKGRTLGTPTANLMPQNTQIPPDGVYVAALIVEGKTLFGVTNVGRRPTMDNDNDTTIETHIFDFDGDIYGVEVELLLLKFLRLPKKFDSPHCLRQQMKIDCNEARNYLGIAR